MRRIFWGAAALAACLTLLFSLLYWREGWDILLTLAITAGTIAYHLGIRLLIGALFARMMRDGACCQARWFVPRRWEAPLYQRLRVRRWKGKMPAYMPEDFDPAIRSWEEIAQAMCRAEWVHEVNMLFSFPPLFAARWFGAFPVFLMTSLLAAAYDGLFAILQRYNRPRVIRLIGKKKRQVAFFCPVSGDEKREEM